MIRKFS